MLAKCCYASYQLLELLLSLHDQMIFLVHMIGHFINYGKEIKCKMSVSEFVVFIIIVFEIMNISYGKLKKGEIKRGPKHVGTKIWTNDPRCGVTMSPSI